MAKSKFVFGAYPKHIGILTIENKKYTQHYNVG
jgi:hypothetical protein